MRIWHTIHPGSTSQATAVWSARLLSLGFWLLASGFWLRASGHACESMITRTRTEFDLTNQTALRNFFQKEKLDEIYLAAAKVGVTDAKNMLRFAQEWERLTVVDEQFGAPTGADLLADVTAHAIYKVLQRPSDAGLYHLTASAETSWHGYEKHVLEQAEKAQPAIKIVATEIAAVPTNAFPTPAKRPHNSPLDTAKLQATFGISMPAWQRWVDRMLSETLTLNRDESVDHPVQLISTKPVLRPSVSGQSPSYLGWAV